jgi:AraC-like DNA-binding protein
MNASLVQHDLSARAVLREWTFRGPYAGAPNAHRGVEIAWCGRGSAEYEIGGTVVILRPGAAIVIPADVEHTTSFHEPGSQARSIHVAPAAFDEARDALGSRMAGARLMEGTVERPSPLAALGSLLAREAEDDRGDKALAVEALTDSVVAFAVRSNDDPGASPRHDPRVKRAVELIHDRYDEPLTIDELARTARMSRFHFSRLFRQETGKSPYRYLLDVRMARAAHLMRVRRCGVTEAAMSVGCTDLGRFGRMFRAAHGVRPSDYLRGAHVPRATSA